MSLVKLLTHLLRHCPCENIEFAARRAAAGNAGKAAAARDVVIGNAGASSIVC